MYLNFLTITITIITTSTHFITHLLHPFIFIVIIIIITISSSRQQHPLYNKIYTSNIEQVTITLPHGWGSIMRFDHIYNTITTSSTNGGDNGSTFPPTVAYLNREGSTWEIAVAQTTPLLLQLIYDLGSPWYQRKYKLNYIIRVHNSRGGKQRPLRDSGIHTCRQDPGHGWLGPKDQRNDNNKI